MSWVARLLLVPVRILFLGIVALLLVVLVDLAISHTKFDAFGVQSGANRVTHERLEFDATFHGTYLLLDPRPAANWLNTHSRALESRLRSPPMTGSPFVNRFLARVNVHFHSVLPAVEVFWLRLLSLVAVMPIIAIGCVVLGVDGWVRREVRKAGAGIESARIYHFAKRSIKPLILWVSLMYLIVPFPVDVRYPYGILAVVIPLLLGIAISRFKKYV